IPRLAVVEFQRIPSGSQNLWAYALSDPLFAEVEKHLLVPAAGETRLSAGECRAAGIRVHQFGGRLDRATQFLAKTVGKESDPLSRSLAVVDPDLVWFNLAGIGEIGWIDAAAAWCRTRRVPY